MLKNSNLCSKQLQKEAAPLPVLSDIELKIKISGLVPKIKKAYAITIIFAIIAIVFMTLARFEIFFAGWFIGLAALIPAVIAGERMARYKKQLKCIVSNNIVRGVLSDKFALEVYSPACHISESVIRQTNLFPKWSRISGSDLVKGTYKDVKFSFSDLHLQHETGSGKNRKVVTKFKGQWLIIDPAKEIPHAVLLRERSGSKAKSDIETESIEFNRRFQITTRDPHTAFYILTPHFIEHILKADKRAGAATSISFERRQVHVALHNGRDLFEPCSKKLYDISNIEMLRMQMSWDAKYITNIIDELLLNENLFNTEGK
jgi:hypothetical protein